MGKGKIQAGNVPRPRIMRARHDEREALVTIHQQGDRGLFPRMIIRVRNGNRKQRDTFAFMCERNNIRAVIVGEEGIRGRQERNRRGEWVWVADDNGVFPHIVYDVSGPETGLERILALDFVTHAEYALSSERKPGEGEMVGRAAGSGKEPTVKPGIRAAKERARQADREERAGWPMLLLMELFPASWEVTRPVRQEDGTVVQETYTERGIDPGIIAALAYEVTGQHIERRISPSNWPYTEDDWKEILRRWDRFPRLWSLVSGCLEGSLIQGDEEQAELWSKTLESIKEWLHSSGEKKIGVLDGKGTREEQQDRIDQRWERDVKRWK